MLLVMLLLVILIVIDVSIEGRMLPLWDVKFQESFVHGFYITFKMLSDIFQVFQQYLQFIFNMQMVPVKKLYMCNAIDSMQGAYSYICVNRV